MISKTEKKIGNHCTEERA